MADTPAETSLQREQEVDLRDPLLAAFLALLWPGAGHIYQRRYAKAVLFMVCVLGTFLFGWDIGGQRTVYASWRPMDRRWHYFCQVWVGLPAWPAMIQSGESRPLGKDFMRQPDLSPPKSNLFNPGADQPTELDQWQLDYHSYYELGTVFTMVAGLLNLLVIFDAAGGPVGSTPAEDEKQKFGKNDRQKKPLRDGGSGETANSAEAQA